MKIQDITFYVKDISFSKNFYEKIGFKILNSNYDFVNFKTQDETVLFSLRKANSENLPGKQECTFSNDNVGGIFQRCKLTGIPILNDLKKDDGILTFAIKDPDGNIIKFKETT